MDEYRKHSPTCRFVLGLADDNITFSGPFPEYLNDSSNADSTNRPSLQAAEAISDSFEALKNDFGNFSNIIKRRFRGAEESYFQVFTGDEVKARRRSLLHFR